MDDVSDDPSQTRVYTAHIIIDICFPFCDRLNAAQHMAECVKR